MWISPAYAQTAGATSGLASFIPLIAMVVVLYFLMIRPQMKRQKEQKNMLASIKVGDSVSTVSGLIGKITEMNDQIIELEVSAGVVVKMQKSAVAALLPPDSK